MPRPPSADVQVLVPGGLGMTIEETATALEISAATAKRDWTLLYTWLQRELVRERDEL